jgi:hypothetical protein
MQYELWARKRPIEGQGFPYERLAIFYDESNKYYMLDTIDKNTYQEGMILRTEYQEEPNCVLYVEFDKPFIKTLKKVNK